MGALDAVEFFAPTESNRWDFLFEDYTRTRAAIERIARSGDDPEWREAMRHYLAAANRDGRGISVLPAMEEAIRDLDAAYWQRAILLTDVLDYMPSKARDEWHEAVIAAKSPPFEVDTVRATMADLLGRRADFLADMVEGIFRGLSGEHVTNRPEGFYKRMIFAGVDYHRPYGGSGLIRDLRMVVGKLMSRGDTPNWASGADAIRYADKTMGEWVTLDGGALRLRTYQKRTAHIEVHPQIAWRLNKILAHRYPLAIPAKFRTKPPRTKAGPLLYDRPLPWPVVRALADMWGDKFSNTRRIVDPDKKLGKHVRREMAAVLCAIGGVETEPDAWTFLYPPGDVIAGIVQSGVIPDQVSHQYYPTPDDLAQRMVDLAMIDPGNTCLEPSAGTGALARLLPAETTTCVEVAALHRAVIESLGYRCHQADFLQWAPDGRFDRVIMNPPYSRGRWKAHVLHALGMLAPRGRLIALLPASARNDCDLSGAGAKWTGVPGTFPGTSMEVAICEVTRAPMTPP